MASAASTRSRVLTDLAVLLAEGGRSISDLAVLRDQLALFGPVASTATTWRVLDKIDPAALTGASWRSFSLPGGSSTPRRRCQGRFAVAFGQP